MEALTSPAGQLAEQLAFSTGFAFKLQHGMIDSEYFQQVVPYLAGKTLRPAHGLIRDHYMAGKSDTV